MFGQAKQVRIVISIAFHSRTKDIDLTVPFYIFVYRFITMAWARHAIHLSCDTVKFFFLLFVLCFYV